MKKETYVYYYLNDKYVCKAKLKDVILKIKKKEELKWQSL